MGAWWTIHGVLVAGGFYRPGEVWLFLVQSYLNSLDTWQATREAIAQVETQGGVLTTAEIAPHLTHRPLVNLTDAKLPPTDLTKFDYVLLNVRHPGWLSNREFATSLVNQLKSTQRFQLSYQRDDVYLF